MQVLILFVAWILCFDTCLNFAYTCNNLHVYTAFDDQLRKGNKPVR